MSDETTTVPTADGGVPTSWQQPPPVRTTAFSFTDFINFRFLITPAFMTVIYVIGVIAIALVAVASLFQNVVAGALILVFGQLYWRIILEFVMVLFKINDSLKSIDGRGKGM